MEIEIIYFGGLEGMSSRNYHELLKFEEYFLKLTVKNY